MRPKRSFKEAKVFFSGKHWFYALKKEVCVNVRSGTAAIISPSFPGSVHDVMVSRSHAEQIKESCKAVPFWQTWATAGPSMTFRQSSCVDVTTGNSELFVLSSSASSDDSNLSVPFFQLPGPLTRMSLTSFLISLVDSQMFIS